MHTVILEEETFSACANGLQFRPAGRANFFFGRLTDDLCNGKAKSGSNSNLLIGQIPHIDRVTGFLQLQRS